MQINFVGDKEPARQNWEWRLWIEAPEWLRGEQYFQLVNVELSTLILLDLTLALFIHFSWINDLHLASGHHILLVFLCLTEALPELPLLQPLMSRPEDLILWFLPTSTYSDVCLCDLISLMVFTGISTHHDAQPLSLAQASLSYPDLYVQLPLHFSIWRSSRQN